MCFAMKELYPRPSKEFSESRRDQNAIIEQVFWNLLAPQVKASLGSREVCKSPLECAPNYCNQKHYFPFPSN
jgi:hypothetical protein